MLGVHWKTWERIHLVNDVEDTSFTYYSFQEFFVRFYALSVRDSAASHLPIAIQSLLVVREINKIEPPQSRTPSLFLLQIWSRTELNDTKYCNKLILTIAVSEKNKVDKLKEELVILILKPLTPSKGTLKVRNTVSPPEMVSHYYGYSNQFND